MGKNMTLIEVLRGGRQCDNDGVEIIMSRQACLEAADEIEKLRAALEAINDLDPNTDSDEGYNEWGEADCFGQAQKLSRTALGV